MVVLVLLVLVLDELFEELAVISIGKLGKGCVRYAGGAPVTITVVVLIAVISARLVARTDSVSSLRL